MVAILTWYYELLTHRNLETTYENFVLEVTTNMGFPQGGVCSAKFWIIAFDEAAKILNSNGVNGELFADDGNGIIGGKDIDHMAQKLNRVCRDLSQWGKKCGLTFNANKTVALLFTKSSIICRKEVNKNGRASNSLLRLCKILGGHPRQQTNMETTTGRKKQQPAKT